MRTTTPRPIPIPTSRTSTVPMDSLCLQLLRAGAVPVDRAGFVGREGLAAIGGLAVGVGVADGVREVRRVRPRAAAETARLQTPGLW